MHALQMMHYWVVVSDLSQMHYPEACRDSMGGDADRGGFGGGFGGGGGGRARGPARQAELGTVARPGSRTNLSSSDVARMQVHALIEKEPIECRVSPACLAPKFFLQPWSW